MTHKTTWKKAEGRAAAIFGTRRKPLSGSSGRDDQTASDSMHAALFIETKYRGRSAVRTLWEDTQAKANKERKTPVVALFDKRKPGALLVVHEADLPTIAAEYIAGLSDEDRNRMEGAIRRSYARNHHLIDERVPGGSDATA